VACSRGSLSVLEALLPDVADAVSGAVGGGPYAGPVSVNYCSCLEHVVTSARCHTPGAATPVCSVAYRFTPRAFQPPGSAPALAFQQLT
jgi:hypothetical protein